MEQFSLTAKLTSFSNFLKLLLNRQKSFACMFNNVFKTKPQKVFDVYC